MRRGRRKLAVGALVLVGASVAGWSPAGADGTPACGAATATTNSDGSVTCTYAYTGGEQTFEVPAGVTSVYVVATGGQGGSGAPGAVVNGVIDTSSLATLGMSRSAETVPFQARSTAVGPGLLTPPAAVGPRTFAPRPVISPAG